METYPLKIPELWSNRPVILFGRYRNGGQHTIEVSGEVEGEPMSWPLTVSLPKEQEDHDVLAKVWARKKIEDLMQHTHYFGSPAVEEEVTAMALDYRLMSPYTSFVAVDKTKLDGVTPGKRPRKMLVPVPLPEGAEWEGFFGKSAEEKTDLVFGVRHRRTVTREAIVAGGAMFGQNQSKRGLVTRFESKAMPASPSGRFSYEARSWGRPSPAGGTPLNQAISNLSLARRYKFARGTSRGGVAGRGRAQDGLESLSRLSTDAKGAALPALYFDAGVAGKDAAKLVERSPATLKNAEALREKGKIEEAIQAYRMAFFLDQVAANYGRSNGSIAMQALAAIEELHVKQVAEWTKTLPALSKRLDLVLRDQSLADAIAKVAAASGLKIAVDPESIDDATTLNSEKPRVSYLDLRGATTAEALDWILFDAQLAWRVKGQGVVAGSDRRMLASSAWLYDVRRMLLPTAEEAKNAKDGNQVALTKAAADGLLAVLRAKIGENQKVMWFAPGTIIVFGSPQDQKDAADLLAGLAGEPSDAKLSTAAVAVRKITSQRAKSHQDAFKKALQAGRRQSVAGMHADYGWQLLAAAANGRADDEAMTQLAIAWNDPATVELLQGAAPAIAMRSLWMILEASRAKPNNERLTNLANSARKKAAPYFAAVKKAAKESPQDGSAFTALLYLALSQRDNSFAPATWLPMLTSVENPTPSVKTAGRLAAALLSADQQLKPADISGLMKQGLQGPDLVALMALACRRAGGETWRTFRAHSKELLQSQELPGHVVVLIHRLPDSQLMMAQ